MHLQRRSLATRSSPVRIGNGMTNFFMRSKDAVRRSLGIACILAWMACGSSLHLAAQSAPPAPAPPGAAPVTIPTNALRPALGQINQTINSLNVPRWKAPGEVRGAAQNDLGSIQRDLSGTLPGLLDQASAAPTSVAAAFAVYRNVDALYDVLLRVADTAVLAGPQNEAASLQNALSALADARKNLGNAILDAATSQEQDLVHLRAAIASTPPPAPPPAAHTVVDDGPAAKPAPRHKKKPATPPPAQSTTQN